MNTALLIKFGIILPLLLFVDYLLMAALGCISCLFGVGDGWYCGTYCLLGKGLLLLSAIVFFALVFPDIRKIYRERTVLKGSLRGETKG